MDSSAARVGARSILRLCVRPGWWALSILVTIGGLGAAFTQIDIPAVRATLGQVSALQLGFVCCALALGAVLASVRLRLIAADVGRPLSLLESMAAMSIGQIAGAVLFQFFGQLAARGVYLSARGVSMPANVVIAVYERLIAFGVSLCLAVAGGWFLFGRIFLDSKQGGGLFLSILAGIAIAILSGAVVAWGRAAIEAIRPFASRRAVWVVARSICLTLGVHLSTGAAYTNPHND